jgi:vacuolar-type H+-ATPase subunit E/Vma4
MQSSENVVNRIIDLDTLAERIRVRAREEADAVRAETQRRLAEERTQLESRISEQTARIEAEAMKKRNGEVDAVRREFADQAKAVESISPDRMARVVDLVLSRIKGTSE